MVGDSDVPRRFDATSVKEHLISVINEPAGDYDFPSTDDEWFELLCRISPEESRILFCSVFKEKGSRLGYISSLATLIYLDEHKHLTGLIKTYRKHRTRMLQEIKEKLNIQADDIAVGVMTELNCVILGGIDSHERPTISDFLTKRVYEQGISEALGLSTSP